MGKLQGKVAVITGMMALKVAVPGAGHTIPLQGGKIDSAEEIGEG